jgi:hypothetical protein
MRNDKYYEPWNERSFKFQNKDEYKYVPFDHEAGNDGLLRTSVVYALWAVLFFVVLTYKDWL